VVVASGCRGRGNVEQRPVEDGEVRQGTLADLGPEDGELGGGGEGGEDVRGGEARLEQRLGLRDGVRRQRPIEARATIVAAAFPKTRTTKRCYRLSFDIFSKN
jgi:hypothetical protein